MALSSLPCNLDHLLLEEVRPSGDLPECGRVQEKKEPWFGWLKPTLLYQLKKEIFILHSSLWFCRVLGFGSHWSLPVLHKALANWLPFLWHHLRESPPHPPSIDCLWLLSPEGSHLPFSPHTFMPQGLCTYSSFYLKCPSTIIFMSAFSSLET